MAETELLYDGFSLRPETTFLDPSRGLHVPITIPEATTIGWVTCNGREYRVVESTQTFDANGAQVWEMKLASPDGSEAFLRHYGMGRLAEIVLPHLTTVSYDPPPVRQLSLAEDRAQRWLEANFAITQNTRMRSRALYMRVAQRRAQRLLLRHLAPEQRSEYVQDGSFEVVAPSGRVWKIATGWEGNIWLVSTPNGEPAMIPCVCRTCRQMPAPVHGTRREVEPGESICVAARHPTESNMPVEDNLLAMKLLFESPGGEEEVLACAN